MENRKFTPEIKNEWIKALKSKKYTQGFGSLIEETESNKVYHCCIGVLGEIHPDLSNDLSKSNNKDTYGFLYDNGIDTKTLYSKNDNKSYTLGFLKRDYSNIIDYIEKLPTK